MSQLSHQVTMCVIHTHDELVLYDEKSSEPSTRATHQGSMGVKRALSRSAVRRTKLYVR